ncbi:hypothetical protein [Myroides marinus]|uniref:hypothetical protein n=1 Tax=Myroides marinus TaxID=703342 RepID=UPI0025784E51|nr:hypothetical protein [Myroides marinus]
MEKELKIAVIGQGYVGLPLALTQHFPVVGFDIKQSRVAELQRGIDLTKEVDESQLNVSILTYNNSGGVKGYKPSTSISDIADANVYIITVPTLINQFNAPDLTPLKSASKLVGTVLN